MAESGYRRVRRPAVARLALGHARLLAGAGAGLATYAAVATVAANPARAIMAWDVAALTFLLLTVQLFVVSGPDRMPADADRQQEGEWTVFFFAVAAILVSFAAVIVEFTSIKGLPPAGKSYHLALVGATLALSWLTSQTIFALRYAHEFYSSSDGSGRPDGGLEFPGEPRPDYLDFGYFALVLGMTFQVSDVQVTSRKFRRVAALHGLLGFLFNTIIIALTVNLASGLLS